MTEERHHSRARRFWDGHGSWVLLLIIGMSCFMAGSQFNATSTGQIIKMLVDSQDAQDAQYRARIRELHDQIERVNGELRPQVQQAVKDASVAADKATQAVEKASQ